MNGEDDSKWEGVVEFLIDDQDNILRIPESILLDMKKKLAAYESQRRGDALNDLSQLQLEFVNTSLEKFSAGLNKSESLFYVYSKNPYLLHKCQRNAELFCHLRSS